MKKMFDTQVSGLLNKLELLEEDVEDAARMTAQSLIGDGHLYVASSADLGGIVSQAVHGADAVTGAERFEAETQLTDLDTVWVFTSSRTETLEAETRAAEAGAVLVTASPEAVEEADSIRSFSLPTGVTRPLLPTESGARTGEPHLLVSLHLYYMLYFQLQEIMEEHGD
ncbi:DUF2529 family protein [Alkalicoccus luteus]|uniref:DUF2529 family protein n=1 Tax=Alkalicoccus luteus TaxID=1237094 RepID=A0A969PNC2_9BACI|nr:DUF2529 family protein [Alkalicoccus luteus]NJP37361.1 DUF2529 family protein [Alkalicoccus luteus]